MISSEIHHLLPSLTALCFGGSIPLGHEEWSCATLCNQLRVLPAGVRLVAANVSYLSMNSPKECSEFGRVVSQGRCQNPRVDGLLPSLALAREVELAKVSLLGWVGVSSYRVPEALPSYSFQDRRNRLLHSSFLKDHAFFELLHYDVIQPHERVQAYSCCSPLDS